MLMLLVVPLVAITGFPQWIPHFNALAFDDDDDDDDDLPWPLFYHGMVVVYIGLHGHPQFS